MPAGEGHDARVLDGLSAAGRRCRCSIFGAAETGTRRGGHARQLPFTGPSQASPTVRRRSRESRAVRLPAASQHGVHVDAADHFARPQAVRRAPICTRFADRLSRGRKGCPRLSLRSDVHLLHGRRFRSTERSLLSLVDKFHVRLGGDPADRPGAFCVGPAHADDGQAGRLAAGAAGRRQCGDLGRPDVDRRGRGGAGPVRDKGRLLSAGASGSPSANRVRRLQASEAARPAFALRLSEGGDPAR